MTDGRSLLPEALEGLDPSGLSYDFDGKRVFLSGPVTGTENFNRDAFVDAENDLYGRGAEYVYSPVDLSPWPGEEPHPHEWYMLRTLRELTFTSPYPPCASVYDAIALLPGWENSEGARVEKLVAEAIGLDVVILEDES